MNASGLKQSIKESFAECGLGPSFRIEALNTFLEIGKWLEDNKFPVALESRYDLYKYVNSDVLNDAPIDYLEFGVCKGASMRLWLELNQAPSSRFFGFDTFEGLPEDWNFFAKVVPRGAFSAGGKTPEIDDPRVEFVEGLFQSVLPGFLERFSVANRLVVHCDADLYTSTLYVLASMSHLMVPGTIVIFDEFSTVEEFRAFRDYTHSFKREFRLLATTGRFYQRAVMELA